MIPPPPKFRGSSDSESISTDDGSIQSAQSQSSQSSKKRRLIKWRKNKKENRTVKGKNKNRRAMSPLRKRGISPLVKSRKSQQEKSVEEILPPQPDGCDERTTRFSEKLAFYEILPREEYSSDEKRSYWLQGHEYQKIAESCMKQVEKIERGLVLKDNKYSSRGLEPLTAIASLERSKHRELEYDLVLYEQSKQREAGFFDDEKLARLAIDTTASSQLWAHVLGLRDSKMTHF